MKTRLKSFPFSLAIVLSVSLIVFPAYLFYNSLQDADFLSPNANCENPDDISLLAGFEKKVKFLGSAELTTLSFYGAHPFQRELLLFSVQTSSLDQNNISLRC